MITPHSSASAIPHWDAATRFVYVIASKSGPIKVGIANDPQRRLNSIQCGYHEALTLAFTAEVHALDAEIIESTAHKLMERHRLRGEWFAIQPDLAARVVRLAMNQVRRGEVRAKSTRAVRSDRGVSRDGLLALFSSATIDNAQYSMGKKYRKMFGVMEHAGGTSNVKTFAYEMARSKQWLASIDADVARAVGFDGLAIFREVVGQSVPMTKVSTALGRKERVKRLVCEALAAAQKSDAFLAT